MLVHVSHTHVPSVPALAKRQRQIDVHTRMNHITYHTDSNESRPDKSSASRTYTYIHVHTAYALRMYTMVCTLYPLVSVSPTVMGINTVTIP